MSETEEAAKAEAAAIAAAKAEAATAEAAARELAKAHAAAHIKVITTEKGANAGGVVKVGTAMEVPLAAFSAAWMKPANATEAKKLVKE